jgi:hypothetical protein
VAARRERGEVEVEGGIWVVGLGRGVGFAVCGLSGIWKASGKFLYKKINSVRTSLFRTQSSSDQKKFECKKLSVILSRKSLLRFFFNPYFYFYFILEFIFLLTYYIFMTRIIG